MQENIKNISFQKILLPLYHKKNIKKMQDSFLKIAKILKKY